MKNDTTETRFAEIKAIEKTLYAELDAKYVEFCDAWEAGEKDIVAKIRDLELAAYSDWEKSPAYAAFQAKQSAKLLARHHA